MRLHLFTQFRRWIRRLRSIGLLKLIIQGVSEFDRQTFRAHSTVKIKHKTLNTCGVKNAQFAR
jgi:hypothetical protein